jgi:hypothetical protein
MRLFDAAPAAGGRKGESQKSQRTRLLSLRHVCVSVAARGNGTRAGYTHQHTLGWERTR